MVPSNNCTLPFVMFDDVLEDFLHSIWYFSGIWSLPLKYSVASSHSRIHSECDSSSYRAQMPNQSVSLVEVLSALGFLQCSEYPLATTCATFVIEHETTPNDYPLYGPSDHVLCFFNESGSFDTLRHSTFDSSQRIVLENKDHSLTSW